MNTLQRNPTRTLVWTFAACVVGYFAVGWLASLDTLLGISWRSFRPDLGFNFAAAFAQLVLAGVVWAQIKTANDALIHARHEAANAADRQRRQRAADSLATFVGHASNASALYSTAAALRLRDVVAQPGDSTCIELARDAIAQANQARQAAHADRFHVRVRTSDGEEVKAAGEFLSLIDGQHQRCISIIAWSSTAAASGAGGAAPGWRKVYEDPEPLRARCLELATALLVSP